MLIYSQRKIKPGSERVILPPRPLLIVALSSLPSTFLHCVCAPPRIAFILRAAPLNCPHCSDLNVCAGLAKPVPPLFHPFYPPDLSVLLLAGFGLLIKRGSIKAFHTWPSKQQPGVRCLVKTRFGRVEPSPL